MDARLNVYIANKQERFFPVNKLSLTKYHLPEQLSTSRGLTSFVSFQHSWIVHFREGFRSFQESVVKADMVGTASCMGEVY